MGKQAKATAVPERKTCPSTSPVTTRTDPPVRYTHARMEPTWAMAPGLYLPHKRGPRGRREAIYSSPTATLTVAQWSSWGADDLRLHLALLALRGGDCRRLPPEPKTDLGRTLRQELLPHASSPNPAHAQDAVTVRTTFRELARIMGVGEGGSALAHIRERLRDAARSTFEVQIQEGQHHILASAGTPIAFAVDETTGQVVVALHPWLARVLLHRAQHVLVSMEHMRMLSGDVAPLLLVHLTAWVRPGQKRVVGLDTLAEHVYGSAANTPDERSDRRAAIRRALDQIGVLPNWRIDCAAPAKSGAPQVRITRRRVRRRAKRQPIKHD